MQELQARQREYQKKLQSWEEILRFWKDRAKRNNERYERRPLDLGFDPSFCPICAVLIKKSNQINIGVLFSARHNTC